MNVGKAVFRALADFSQVRRESSSTARDLGRDAEKIDKSYSRAGGFGGSMSRVFQRIRRDSGTTARSVEGDGRGVDRPWVAAAKRVERAWGTSLRGVRQHSSFLKKDLHKVAQDVGNSGTVGGRAFVQGMVRGLGGLSVIPPLIGAIASAAISGVGNILTFGRSLGALAGVAALVPAALGATAASVGVLLASFKGVGKAVTAIAEAKNKAGAGSGRNPALDAMAVEDASRQIQKAEQRASQVSVQGARQVASAKKSLRQVIVDVAERQAAAAQKVVEAERDVARANREVTRAQTDLNMARQEAVQRIQDLERSLEGAGLGERAAAIRYEEALAAFNEAKAKGGDNGSLEMRKLALDVDEAAFSLKNAKDETKKLTAEQNLAKIQGVSGSKEVKDAEEAVNDAVMARTDSIKARDEAVRDVTRTEQEGAQRISEAQQQIADAQEQAAQSQADAAESVADAYRNLERVQMQQADTGSKGADEVAEALSDLTPAATVAVAALSTVYGMLGRVRRIAQENFFTGFAGPLLAMATVLMPQLERGVGRISTSLGVMAQALFGAFNTTLGGGALEAMLNGTADVLDRLAPAILPFVNALVTLGVVGMQYLPRLATGFTNLIIRFDEWVQKNADNGNMFDWIENGLQGFSDLFSVIGSIIGIFGALTDAAEAGGAVSTLAGLADGLNKVETAMKGATFQTTMATIFAGAEAGAKGLMGALGPLGQAFVDGAPALGDFLRLGGEIVGLFAGALFTALSNPSFGAGLVVFMEGLQSGVQAIAPLLPNLTTSLGYFLEAMAPIVAVLGPSLVTVFGGIASSLATLIGIFEPFLLMIAGSPAILGFLIVAFGATRAASAALTAAGNIQRVAMGLWWAATKAGTAAMWLFNNALKANPIGLVITAIGLLVAGLVWFFTKTETGQRLWEGFMSGMRDAAEAVSTWFTGTFVPALSGAWDSISAAWGSAVEWFKGVWDGISGGAGDAAAMVTAGWTGMGEWFSGIWSAISTAGTAVWGWITTAAQGALSWFTGTLVPGILGFAQAVATPFLWIYNTIIKPTFDSILVIANGLLMGLRGVFDLIGAALRLVGAVFLSLYNAHVKPVFDWIWAKISAVVGSVVAFLTERLAVIRRTWDVVWSWISSKVSAVWNAIWSTISAVWSMIWGWLSRKLEDTKRFWGTVWDWISWKLGVVWAALKGTVVNVFTSIVRWISEKLESLKRTWSFAWDWLKTRATEVWNGLKNTIRDTYNRYIKPIFDALGTFVRDTLPDRFDKGIAAIGKIWNKLKELARVPISFVIEDVINKGLIENFNKIARKLKVTELPSVKMPFGLATGGEVPGSSPTPTADNVPIMATAGEFMLRHFAAQKLKRQQPGVLEHINRTGELPVQHLATGGEVAGEAAFFHGNASNVARHGAYYLNVPASMAPWNFKGAASLWDGASGAKVKTGMGRHQGWASERERGGGILGYTQGTNIDMSPSWMRQLGAIQRRTTAAHEMGHAMGLPHTNRQSIMKPNLGDMSPVPTAFDIRNMQTLFPGGSGKAGSGEGGQSGLDVFAGLKKLLDGVLNLVKDHMPGTAKPFVDVAKGVGTKAFDSVVEFAKNQLANIKEIAEKIWNGIKSFVPGLGASAGEDETLYDDGGKVKTGRTNVRNASGKPEALLTSAQWAQVMALIAIASQLTKEVSQSQSMLVPPVVDFGALLGKPDTSTFFPPPAGGGNPPPVINENVGDHFYVDKLEINNPKQERSSESLPKSIRALSGVGVRKQ